MLPSLSNLHIGEGLFEYLARSHGGKGECTRHEEPATRENHYGNCAVGGYLMYLKLTNTATKPVTLRPDQTINVAFEFNKKPFKMDMMPMGMYKTGRWYDFCTLRKEYILGRFEEACTRSHETAIDFDEYGYELCSLSEHYYIDEDRGHLFVCTMDNEKKKKNAHLPSEGVCAGKYLYISLVCSDKGYGKILMALAMAFAEKVGCSGVLLASMSNSAGFYFSRGYKFITSQGAYLDVEMYINKTDNGDGTAKHKLITNPDKPEEKSSKKRSTEQSTEEKTERSTRPRVTSRDGGYNLRRTIPAQQALVPPGTHHLVSFVMS